MLSEQKVARFGCLHESVQMWNRAGQKVDLLFSGPKLAHLAVQKFVQFRRSRVNARWNCASFVRAKICPDLCKRGLSCSKIRPVPPVPCKRKVELCKFLSVQRFVRTRVNGASRRRCVGFLGRRHQQQPPQTP